MSLDDHKMRGPLGWIQTRVGWPRTFAYVMGYWMVALGVVYITQPEGARERTALYRLLVDVVDPRFWGHFMLWSGVVILAGAIANRTRVVGIGATLALGGWLFATVLYLIDFENSWPQVFQVAVPILLLLLLLVATSAVSSRVSTGRLPG
jgi:hypothetical protein